jgi:hypothetical protein
MLMTIESVPAREGCLGFVTAPLVPTLLALLDKLALVMSNMVFDETDEATFELECDADEAVFEFELDEDKADEATFELECDEDEDGDEATFELECDADEAVFEFELDEDEETCCSASPVWKTPLELLATLIPLEVATMPDEDEEEAEEDDEVVVEETDEEEELEDADEEDEEEEEELDENLKEAPMTVTPARLLILPDFTICARVSAATVGN